MKLRGHSRRKTERKKKERRNENDAVEDLEES